MKMVIYKALDTYCETTQANYNARISDARKVHVLRDFTSAQEIIDYYCKWFNCKPDDFIVIDP